MTTFNSVNLTRPTYTYSQLLSEIPTACLEEIKEILSIVTSEQALYQSATFTNILLLLNQRAMDLIRQIKSARFEH